jgi:hypothetical protein
MRLQEYLGIEEKIFTLTFSDFWYYHTPKADLLINTKTKEKFINKVYNTEPLSKQLNIKTKPLNEILQNRGYIHELLAIYYNCVDPIYKENAAMDYLLSDVPGVNHYWARLPIFGTIFEYANRYQDITILDEEKYKNEDKVIFDYNEIKSKKYDEGLPYEYENNTESVVSMLKPIVSDEDSPF